MLWAAKESAFKVARKLDASVVFSPRRFVVHLDASGRGSVFFGELEFAVDVTCDADLCHAVAFVSEPAATTAIRRLTPGEDPRAAVRRLAIERLSLELGGSTPGELAVVKERGIPRIFRRGDRLPFDVSFSHHGRFVALAYRRAVA